jgi:hypothetical protein
LSKKHQLFLVEIEKAKPWASVLTVEVVKEPCVL